MHIVLDRENKNQSETCWCLYCNSFLSQHCYQITATLFGSVWNCLCAHSQQCNISMVLNIITRIWLVSTFVFYYMSKIPIGPVAGLRRLIFINSLIRVVDLLLSFQVCQIWYLPRSKTCWVRHRRNWEFILVTLTGLVAMNGNQEASVVKP